MSDEVLHNPIRVDIDARHNVSIFDIFERIELIPLETTDESVFYDARRLLYHDSVLYVFDIMGHKILAFDSKGKFLFKIDDKGQGSQEYLHVSDFEIDKIKKKLLILDPVAGNLIEYDLSGKFLYKTKLPSIINAYNQLKCLDDDVIAFWTFDNKNRLKLYDRNRRSIFSEHFPAREESILDHFIVGVFSYANFMIRESALNNNIYEIFPNGTYSIAYAWDFGKLNNRATIIRNLPEQARSLEEIMVVADSEIVNYFFQHIGGNQTYRYAQITRKNQTINLLHNIFEGKTCVFTKFSEGIAFFPIFWSDEFVIGLGPFAGYNEETISNVILDEENLEIKRNIDEYDNPVLVKYYFKK
jgi:hypothetical protein